MAEQYCGNTRVCSPALEDRGGGRVRSRVIVSVELEKVEKAWRKTSVGETQRIRGRTRLERYWSDSRCDSGNDSRRDISSGSRERSGSAAASPTIFLIAVRAWRKCVKESRADRRRLRNSRRIGQLSDSSYHCQKRAERIPVSVSNSRTSDTTKRAEASVTVKNAGKNACGSESAVYKEAQKRKLPLREAASGEHTHSSIYNRCIS